MSEEKQLKAFKNDTDTFSAYSLDDVIKLAKEDYDYDEEFSDFDFEELDPNEPITVATDFNDWDDMKDNLPKRSSVDLTCRMKYSMVGYLHKSLEEAKEAVTKNDFLIYVRAPAGEWAKLGRGMICSTEW